MKLHWGHGLAAAMSAFAAFMLYFLLRATAEETVRDKPYEQGLKYQERLDAAQNVVRFSPCTVVVQNMRLYLRIRGEKPEGQWTMRYAASAKHDFSQTLSPKLERDYWEDSTTRVLTAPGLWTVEAEWTDGKRPYYYQQKIQMP